MTNLDYLLALNAVSGLGTSRIQKLIEHFGTPQKVFEASERDLAFIGFLPQQARSNLKNFPIDTFLKKEYALIKKHEISVVTLFDKTYSTPLKEISDPPVVLYCKGNLKFLNEPSVAVVGCRRASVYGMTTAEKFAQELSDYAIVVVSGLARGIDTAAHQGALRVQGKTIAVLGNGLANVYPPENKKLFEAIAQSGLVVSEFPIPTLPKAYNFPRRNRIISGLSLGVIVVEAARRSGALITADLALEQGREVFAVPGKVDSASAQGVNELIKQGAKLVSRIDDIIEELQIPQLPVKKIEKTPTEKNDRAHNQSLSEDEMSLIKLLSARAIDIDAISQRSGFSISRVSSILLHLELKGLIKQMPGKLFVLK